MRMMMMMIRRRTHNIYNLLESESEGEVDRLAVVEHWSLQARRQRTVTFFILFSNVKNFRLSPAKKGHFLFFL